MLKQQIPNHQLHKISHKTSPPLDSSHKTNPSLNSSHKMSPSLNSHKARPPLNNKHKTKHLILSCLNPGMMIHHFQIMPQLSKLLRRKIPVLYQRNLDIVYDQKQNIFNPFCLIFSLQIKRKTSYILENSRIVTKCHVCQFFLIYHLPVIYSLKCIFAFSFQYQSDVQLIIFLFPVSILLTPLTNCSCSSSVPVLIPAQ